MERVIVTGVDRSARSRITAGRAAHEALLRGLPLRVARTMPVLTVDAGRSEAGRRAAASHTAAAATRTMTRQALFTQAGVTATHTIGEILDTAALLHSQPLPTGTKIAVVTNAGGAGVLAADACGTPFKEVARLLGEHCISGLPVIDEDDKVIGVISETDLMLRQSWEPEPDTALGTWLSRSVRRASAKTRARTAGGLMSTPAVTVRADASVPEAARLMAEHRIERLPVVDEEDRLVGIVTRRDLLQVFLRTDKEIRQEVEQEVLVNTLWLAPHIVEVTVKDGVVTLTGQLERRSEKPITLAMTSRMDGVVGVVDHLSYQLDDTRRQPAEQALHGVADDWLRKL